MYYPKNLDLTQAAPAKGRAKGPVTGHVQNLCPPLPTTSGCLGVLCKADM